MKSPNECNSIEEIDHLIAETGRHMLGLDALAQSRNWSAAERAANMKLDAMCKALERRQYLVEMNARTALHRPLAGAIG